MITYSDETLKFNNVSIDLPAPIEQIVELNDLIIVCVWIRWGNRSR